MVKHAVALKLGTAESDVIFKKFNKSSKKDHPLLKALYELGNANRTIFVCRYLMSEDLRIEIHEALNVVERLNSIM